MKLQSYGCYTIQSALGAPGEAGYIHIPNASLDMNTTITVWGFDTRGVDFTNHFEFVLIPVPEAENTFYLVNRRSGLALQVVDPKTPGGPQIIVQAKPGEGKPDDPSDDEVAERAAQFVFERTEDRGVFMIANQSTGTYLSIKDTKTANGTPLIALPAIQAAQGTDEAPRRFRMDLMTSLMGKVPTLSTKTGPRFPRLANLDIDLPGSTPAQLREVDVIPFFAINDAVYPRHRQVEASPYYTLSLSTMWRKVNDRQVDGIVERETVETTETGLTTIDAQSVASTFGWSVALEAQAGVKKFGFSASLKVASKLAGETRKTAESTAQHNEAHTFTETILYPAIGEPYRLVTWRPVDRYELRRKDGSLVESWDALRPEEEAIDVFPTKTSVPGRKLSPTQPARAARAAERKALSGVGS